MEDTAFSLNFNSSFNEQFNRDYVKQQELLAANPRFLRTRQSVEAERSNAIGIDFDTAPYPMYAEDTLKATTLRKAAFGHQNAECNLLNQLYLSPENIENLQQRIRYEVWLASNKQHIIAKQKLDELVIIMRSIYFTYGKNLPTNIKGQIQELNDLVVQDAVPKILSGIEGDVRYLFDAATNPMPLALPLYMSNKGQKILPSVTSVFNV